MRCFLIIKRSWPAGVIYSPKPMFIPFAVWPSSISALCDCEKVCVFLFVFIPFANESQVTGVCSLTICQGYLFLASAKIQNCAGQKACSRARAQVINESLRFYLAHLGYTRTLQHSLHETLHTPLPVKGTVHSEKENWHHLLTLIMFQIWNFSFSLI